MPGAVAGEGGVAGGGIGASPAFNDGSGIDVDGAAGDGASGLIVDSAPGGVSEVDSSGTAERDEGGAAVDRVADKPRQLAVNTIPANPRWSIQDVRMIFSNNIRAARRNTSGKATRNPLTKSVIVPTEAPRLSNDRENRDKPIKSIEPDAWAPSSKRPRGTPACVSSQLH